MDVFYRCFVDHHTQQGFLNAIRFHNSQKKRILWHVDKIGSVNELLFIFILAELPWAWVCEDGQWALCCLVCSLFNNGEDLNLCYFWASVQTALCPTYNPLLLFCFSFSDHKKRGKVEEVQRKVGVVLLNGQKLELSCDIKAVCKDVLDMVVAHIGLVEHHLFGLAYLRGTVCCSCPSLWVMYVHVSVRYM